MADCYPSRRAALQRFRRLAGLLGLPRLVVRPKDPSDRHFGQEQVIRVPGDFDYHRAPYRPGFLVHLLEDFEGIPITFQDCVRPLVVAFEEASGTGN